MRLISSMPWSPVVRKREFRLKGFIFLEEINLFRQKQNYGFWKRCFLKTSVSNGIIYTKYTQNPHTIEPPFNIATQSAT